MIIKLVESRPYVPFNRINRCASNCSIPSEILNRFNFVVFTRQT